VATPPPLRPVLLRPFTARSQLTPFPRRSKLALPVLGVVAIANVVIHFQHGHHHEEPKFSYQHIRKKKFPWECSDCALFDGECWSKCRKN